MSDDEISHDKTTAPTGNEEANANENVPAHRWYKGMQSPNKKGRPKQPRTVKEVKELAKQYTHQMVEVLSRVALNPKSPPAARTAAALGLLDRAWGKPSGDFEGLGEGLTIQIVKFNNPQIEPEMKVIEGEVARDENENN